MIISASRRTDIPAFYPEWFVNRIHEGYVLVQNPMNPKQISRISLAPEVVDAIVFWTKNPQNIIKYLRELDDYNYYFLFTITCFDQSIESGVPDKNIVIDTFKKLSDLIGPEKVIWRYDPIFFTDNFDYKYHLEFFENTARTLRGKTHKCIISFLDLYKKCENNMRGINFRQLTTDEIHKFSAEIARIAHTNNIIIETCAEKYDLQKFGISPAKCIDDELISRIAGKRLQVKKDKNQRSLCNCVKSIDIGAYNTCIHNCLYCYANLNKQLAARNFEQHNPNSPQLCGQVSPDTVITERKVKSLFINQPNLI
jgi:hypothetical protein